MTWCCPRTRPRFPSPPAPRPLDGWQPGTGAQAPGRACVSGTESSADEGFAHVEGPHREFKPAARGSCPGLCTLQPCTSSEALGHALPGALSTSRCSGTRGRVAGPVFPQRRVARSPGTEVGDKSCGCRLRASSFWKLFAGTPAPQARQWPRGGALGQLRKALGEQSRVPVLRGVRFPSTQVWGPREFHALGESTFSPWPRRGSGCSECHWGAGGPGPLPGTVSDPGRPRVWWGPGVHGGLAEALPGRHGSLCGVSLGDPLLRGLCLGHTGDGKLGWGVFPRGSGGPSLGSCSSHLCFQMTRSCRGPRGRGPRSGTTCLGLPGAKGPQGLEDGKGGP